MEESHTWKKHATKYNELVEIGLQISLDIY